jgi:ureidoglycolate lyase
MQSIALSARDATVENFAPYGVLITDGCDASNEQLQLTDSPRLWLMSVRQPGLEFSKITRHRTVTQCLASADARPWYLGLAAPGSDPAADPDSINVLRIPAGAFALLHCGTWHAGPHFEMISMRFFNLESTTTNIDDHETVDLQQLVVIDPDGSGMYSRLRSRRVLVVANRTANSAELLAAVRRLADSGVSSFRVVVPATVSVSGLQSMASAWDPFAGVPPISPEVLPSQIEEAQRAAQDQLDGLLTELRSLGADATGEVGSPDPIAAISAALSAGPADEILLSTLPAGLSRWLSRDLPSKCAKRFGLPVTHVEAVAGT